MISGSMERSLAKVIKPIAAFSAAVSPSSKGSSRQSRVLFSCPNDVMSIGPRLEVLIVSTRHALTRRWVIDGVHVRATVNARIRGSLPDEALTMVDHRTFRHHWRACR